jgi:hypothetical protein
MADRFNHPDSVKARDIRLRGGKLVGPVSRVPEDKPPAVDPAKRSGGAVTEAPKESVPAGSYSKSRRKGYEDMLEEAGK